MSLEMKELLKSMPQTGKVEWIGVRPARRAPIDVLDSVEILEPKLNQIRSASSILLNWLSEKARQLAWFSLRL